MRPWLKQNGKTDRMGKWLGLDRKTKTKIKGGRVKSKGPVKGGREGEEPKMKSVRERQMGQLVHRQSCSLISLVFETMCLNSP